MPSRGSYHVASREEGKAAQRDQSYRSCVLALLIFLFLCIVLIVACLPWKKGEMLDKRDDGSKDNDIGAKERHHGDHEVTKITEPPATTTTMMPKTMTTMTSTTPGTTQDTTEGTTQDTAEGTTQDTAQSTTPETKPKIVEDPARKHSPVKSDRRFFERYYHYETTTSPKSADITTDLISSNSTSSDTDLHSEAITRIFNHPQAHTTTTTTTTTTMVPPKEFTDPYETSTVGLLYSILTSKTTTKSPITRDNTEHDENLSTNSAKPFYKDNLIVYTTEASDEQNTTDVVYNVTELQSNNDDSSIAYTHSTTNRYLTEEHDTSINDPTDRYSAKSEKTTEIPRNFTYSTTTESVTTSDSSVKAMHTFATTASTSRVDYTPPPVNEVCKTSSCKQIASKMLFFMNHTIHPCDDFYEYACGGFEANPQTIDDHLESRSYQRIAKQMVRKVRGKSSRIFKQYYDSCVNYETNVNISERIVAAKKALSEIGKFYTTDDWANNRRNFTDLLAQLLLHHSALLFDVSPDINETSSEFFTLKIGPTPYKSLFDTDETDDCSMSEAQTERHYVNLTRLYKDYETCKKDKREFVESIPEALEAFGVFSELNNTFNVTQYISHITINIDTEILQGFFSHFPSRDKIQEAYLTKNYQLVTLRKLEEECKIVNWTHLIHSLTGNFVEPDGELQIYFYDELIKGLNSLDEFRQSNEMQLNNALLGLYARYFYKELVLARHWNVKEHCLRVAAHLLYPEASSLYLTSFSVKELYNMKGAIHEIFGELKETLKLKIEEMEWAEDGGHELLQKIDDLEVTVPDISYLTDSISVYRKNEMDEVELSDDYINNTMTLLRRYRKLIYVGLYEHPGDPEQIWTHYATPFQSRAVFIYGLNLVVIPFGVIDWSTILEYDDGSFDHLRLATLGNLIAHQIAHHFDANGIYYWNKTRHFEHTLLHQIENGYTEFEDCVNCQKNQVYGEAINMTLPSTGQIVSLKIPELTLNERLSEIMGLRLTYETLARVRSVQSQLPWLKLEFNQIFYLAYAQMYCTKSPLTSSYKSFYEDERLPSRALVFVSATHAPLLAQAWDCPKGSVTFPAYACNVFPYFETEEYGVNPV
ncbi:hypothetical protein KM043_009186 [Ampulex compressa]|nr:hypothetical protein KM043_009186 [Ampulex compressa]